MRFIIERHELIYVQYVLVNTSNYHSTIQNVPFQVVPDPLYKFRGSHITLQITVTDIETKAEAKAKHKYMNEVGISEKQV